jgi:pilus assembly protein Flp/PilA
VADRIRNAFPSRQEGQGMVEYGLIIALVAVVAIAGLIILGPRLSSMFSSLGSSV